MASNASKVTLVGVTLICGMALLTGPLGVRAQSKPPAPPESEPVTELTNLGTLPFTAVEGWLLRPEDKAAIRRLEDKHLKELRDLEDKYAADLLSLRKTQAEERVLLQKTFKR